MTQNMQQFQDDQGEWADNTFGVHKDPLACYHHLTEEVQELIDAANNLRQESVTLEDWSAYESELADVFSLTIDGARRSGINAERLLILAYRKLAVNKERKWGEPDENGVIKHIE